MSRASIAAPQRNLNLTEELEKLEHRAHRIVTTSILPIVEQYAQHSSAVWEGSKFWKQFFEASANVSLSSYEEPPEGDQEPTTTSTEAGVSPSQEERSTQFTPSSSSYPSPSQPEDQVTTPEPRSYRQQDEESTFSTPRPSKPAAKPSFSSPYESLKRNINPPRPDEEPSTSTLPSTPRAQASPSDSSPFAPPPSTTRPARTPSNDVLLHRVLDKNWRLQATPHTQPKLPNRSGAFSSIRKGGGAPTETPRPGAGEDEDELDDSSPFVPAPELHAEIFESPLRRTRVPGVSVLTPAKGKRPDEGLGARAKGREKGVWDSDSDDDGLDEGMSPPKTMQFHLPRERLLRTPAREASKRIVEDLLLTAGANVTDDLDEDSPSVVRRTQALDEDTF